MGIDLTTVTDSQLIREMHMRFKGRFCVWKNFNIECALDGCGYKITPENVEIVWKELDSHGPDLEDRMCEVGWDFIYCAIDYAKDKLEKFEED